MNRQMRRRLAAGMLVFAGGTGSASAQTPSLSIVQPPRVDTGTRANDLARSGSALAGIWLGSSTGDFNGYRWTQAGGRVDLPSQFADAISQDGLTVAGVPGGFARVWDAVNGPRDIAAPSGMSLNFAGGRAAVGNNGSWLVTTARSSTNPNSQRPMRWTPSQGWSNLPGSYSLYTELYDVAPSGQAWVGKTQDFSDLTYFVHRNNLQETLNFEPRALSDNGNSVVGYNVVSPGISYSAILSTLSSQTELPNVLGFERGSIATDVSNDGSVVVGRAFTFDGRDDAFYWSASSGSRLIRDVLADAGLILPQVRSVTNVQVDASGTVVSGTYNTGLPFDERAFIAVIPSPASVLLPTFALPLSYRRKR